MKQYFFAFLSVFLLTVISGKLFIPLLKKLKAKQTILKYVSEHKSKNGTPTMGGLFFLLPASIIFLIFGGFWGRIATVCLVICLAYMAVGFLDDFIKIKFKQNDGLKPYQKIIFQVAVGLLSGIFAYKSGLTEFFIPFTKTKLDLGFFTVFAVAFIFIANTNCVNLTDGLDGLASTTSSVYLILIIILTFFQGGLAFPYIVSAEYNKIFLLCFCFLGGLLAFLLFNTQKASVFMGDTGSLALGGLLASVSLFTGNGFYIPIFGIMFVVSGVSVILQVFYYKKTKKRIFLMAPFHHHLQMKGISESKISYIYLTVTLIVGVLSMINYL